jgi:hypothetical protein
MNVLVYSMHLLWPSHYETELELIERHLEAGDAVVHAVCDRQLGACDSTPTHWAHNCTLCVEKREKGRRLLRAPVPTIPIVDLGPEEQARLERVQTEFADLDALKAYRFDGFDIGMAAASSIISWLRDPRPDVVKHRAVVREFVRSAAEVYLSAGRYLDRRAVDRVYAFNGRLAHSRAILRACQERGVDCQLHERGSGIGKYMLYPNALPHEIAAFTRLVRGSWQAAAARPDRDAVGGSWFKRRARGVATNWYSFTKHHEEKRLPEGWEAHPIRVAIFNSSEDEFASIGDEWKQPIYESQLDGIARIARALEGQDRVHLFLRMHPNNRGMDRRELERWYALRSKALTIIPPQSPVSTYTLLRRADKVLAFGSTVGIEATYWGKPSILAGPALYRDLGGTYNPATHEEVVSLLLAEDLPPKDRSAALMYGYHAGSCGEPFRFFEAKSFAVGAFKGVNLDRRDRAPWRAWLSEKARKVKSLYRKPREGARR